MIKPIFPELVSQEKDYLFKHFDKDMNQGYIKAEDFISALGQIVKDTSYTVSITVEDIFKPMANRKIDTN